MTAKANTVKTRRTTETNAITFTLGSSGSAVQFIKSLATESKHDDIVKKLNAITGINYINVWGYNVNEKLYIVPVEISFNYRETGLDPVESRDFSKLYAMMNQAQAVAEATNASIEVIVNAMGINTAKYDELYAKRINEGEKHCYYIPDFDVSECALRMIEFIDINGDKVLGKL